MEHENLNLQPNQVAYPPILFVTVQHIMKLLGKGKTTANEHLAGMRKKYLIVKPREVTINIVCDYYMLTEEQFYRKVYNISIIYQIKVN